MERIDQLEELVANQQTSVIKSAQEKINIPNDVRVRVSVTVKVLTEEILKETGAMSRVEIPVGTYLWQQLLEQSITSCFDYLLYKSSSLTY